MALSKIVLTGLKFYLKTRNSVTNGGHKKHYFNLECGTCQANPISEYFFILVLEILFILTKSNKKIHVIKIFKHISIQHILMTYLF